MLQHLSQTSLEAALMGTKRNDKIKVRLGVYQGHRGTIEKVLSGGQLSIHIGDIDHLITLSAQSIINYSAAARKAWETMPSRRVGRPLGTKLVDRISVTLRIDKQLWTRFRDMENQGKVNDRSETIESLLQERLEALDPAIERNRK